MKFRQLHDRVEGSIVVGKVLANRAPASSMRIPHYRDVGRKKSTIIFCDASGASDLELKYDRLSVRSFLTRARS